MPAKLRRTRFALRMFLVLQSAPIKRNSLSSIASRISKVFLLKLVRITIANTDNPYIMGTAKVPEKGVNKLDSKNGSFGSDFAKIRVLLWSNRAKETIGIETSPTGAIVLVKAWARKILFFPLF